jgi:peptide/nickel transport system substrate-binding protein
MINRTTKLRWRRKYRLKRRQVEDYSQQAEDHLDRHFFKRLNRINGVRRFIGSWLLLFVILIGISIAQTYGLSSYYQKLKPSPGGTYNEGIVGTFTNANPLFATSDVDTSVSKLIFPGLFKYNQSNQLVGDLAQSYASDARGQNYTVILKDNLKWQDGTPLTAQDVVFTYQTIENPDVGSPLFSDWQGVKVTALNGNTIQFSLPDPLSSFPYNMTNGIIPEHILSGVPADELRTATFNTTDPIGAGPFKLSEVDVLGSTPSTYEEQIGLSANPLYYGGAPKLDRFVENAFNNQTQMVDSFSKGELNGMAGLTTLPSKYKTDNSVVSYNIPLTAEVMVFFNTQQAPLNDAKVRQALVQGINENSVIAGLGYPVIPARSPLLPFQLGYNSQSLQQTTNLAEANQTLTADGWIMGTDGIRYKAGQPLQFTLFTQDNSEFDYVAGSLESQWKKIGVEAQVLPQQATDLQTIIQDRAYNSILYGISIGVDPDVFAYWDSSQALPNAVPGLNLSLYENATVDQSLEEGRTRTDPALRAAKYIPFLQEWVADAPALALYQPRYLYVTSGHLYGFSPTIINNGTDRFSDIDNWEIREIRTTD